MTQEERKLLLKDLCARLPYNPYISIKEDNIRTLLTSIEADQDGIIEIWYEGTPHSIEDIELYLRPMESMTDEEKEELYQKTGFKIDDYILGLSAIDWLNAHHFDYRDLIPMGLALKAPEGMYLEEN